MRAAAIDAGTNSIQMVIGETNPVHGIQLLYDSTINARLGEGLASTGIICSAAEDRALDALSKHLQTAAEFSVNQIKITGTNVFRDASNSSQFIEKVHDRLGIVIEPISGDMEARLSYTSVSKDPQLGGFKWPQTIIDIGGGSTEIIHGTVGNINFSTSIRIGAVRVTEQYLSDYPITTETIQSAESAVDYLIMPVADMIQSARIVGIGGTTVNLARMICDVPVESTQNIHAVSLGIESINSAINMLISLPVEKRKNITGLEPERADVILGGAIILQRLMMVLKMNEILASARGLRHAVLYEMLTSNI